MEPIAIDIKDMKKWITPLAGLLLIVVGVLALVVAFIAHFADANAFRLAALGLIICGIVVYVAAQKLESRY